MDFRDILKSQMAEYMEYLELALQDLTPEERRFQPTPESNHIDFIVWHMARVEDTLFNRAILRRSDLWEREGWGDKLGISAEGNGYRFGAEQAANLPNFSLDDLMDYYRSVRGEIVEYIDTLTEDDLDALPNPRRPEYPVGETLKHIIVEEAQHVGQIAYIRGIQRGFES